MTISSTNHRSTSDVLLALVREFSGERISIQDVINGLGERSFGFVLLLFGLLSAVAPPGVATFTALPLMFFGLQMLAGYPTPWLPTIIAKRDMTRGDLQKTLERGVPIMRRIERFCRPRYLFLIGSLGERLLGLLVFILAVVIALPGPLTNAPPGLAIAFMSIAIIERDGLLVFAGVLASCVALYLGYLGLHLFIAHIVPAVWESLPAVREFLVSTWNMIF